MIEQQTPRVQKLGNWAHKDQSSLEKSRIAYITKNTEQRSWFFLDNANQARWNLTIDSHLGLTMASMLCAYEHGIRQVYYKVGYTDDQIDQLPNYRIAVGSLVGNDASIPQKNTRQKYTPVAVFAYLHSAEISRFGAVIDRLYTLANFALNHNGASQVTLPEVESKRPLHIYEFCELAGVEEAAHSLFMEYHPNRNPIINLSHRPLPLAEHFQLPAERAALKWKRNYALRFMPDIAQGFVDFENGLATHK